MASTIVSSPTSPVTERLAGLPGRRDQSTTFLFGSASITATEAPRSARTVARMVAAVVFPAPPLGELNAITGMGFPSSRRDGDAERLPKS